MFLIEEINDIIKVMDGKFYYYSGLYEDLPVKESEELCFTINDSNIDYFKEKFPKLKIKQQFMQNVGLVVIITK